MKKGECDKNIQFWDDFLGLRAVSLHDHILNIHRKALRRHLTHPTTNFVLSLRRKRIQIEFEY
jgi:hypothetical protein